MKRLLVSFTLVACSAAPVAKPSPAVTTTTQPIRCSGGRELDFTRKLENGDLRRVTIECTDEHVTASITTLVPPPPDLDAAYGIRETGGSEIDHALFDRVWRAAFARADERGCNRRRNRDATTVLTLRDTRGKREVTCFDLDVTDIVESVSAVVKVAPPQPAPAGESWPFHGEYWRDELGYYRQVVTSKCPK